MKKFFLFILLFCAPFCSFAQDEGVINDVKELPISYDVKIMLKQDSSAIIVEKFTIYADDNYLLPFFKRKIKTDKKLENISLYLNNRYMETIPRKNEDSVTILGIDNIEIRPGKNTVMLTYKLPKAVYSLFNTDNFAWDLQLDTLPYISNKGKVVFNVSGNPTLKKGKIIFKNSQKEETFDLEERIEFPIDKALQDKWGVSLTLAFKGGFFEGTKLTTDHLLDEGFASAKSMFIVVPVLIMLMTVIYSFTIWNKYGKDPKGPFVTEYNPPADITPAFAKAMLNRKIPFDFSYFIITLLNLSLNNYIKITDHRGEICIESLKGTDSKGLKEEDKIIYDSLFAYSPRIVLNKENGVYIGNAIKALFIRMKRKREEYFTPNYWCMVIPLIFTIISFLLLLSFKGTELIVAVVCFVICLVTLVFFFMIIDNVSPRYRKVYCKIVGFRQYMQIAEEGRVHFSDPLDEQRLFCDYLAYAYAFGMENRIIRKVKYKFDIEAIEAIKDYLYRNINSQITAQNFVDALKI